MCRRASILVSHDGLTVRIAITSDVVRNCHFHRSRWVLVSRERAVAIPDNKGVRPWGEEGNSRYPSLLDGHGGKPVPTSAGCGAATSLPAHVGNPSDALSILRGPIHRVDRAQPDRSSPPKVFTCLRNLPVLKSTAVLTTATDPK
jgi:hypothetical protein